MSTTAILRARVASELNRALTDAFGNANETFGQVVNREVNSAIKAYQSQPFRWNQVRRSEFATATAYIPTVSLPADFLAMRTLEVIYQGRYYRIPQKRPDQIDAMNYMASMTAASVSIPSGYMIEGNVIVLAPPCNAARTLAATYTKRFLPTSMSGSFTAVIPVAGSYTMSVTSSLSHDSRCNGWTTDGASLIRARAKAAIEIFYLKKPDAIAEMEGIASRREPYLCVAEAIAYRQLQDETNDILSTGLVRPYNI